MEVVLGNGYANGWLYDRMNRINRLFNEAGWTAPEGHVAPRADVVEDGEGYHFYFDMPGIKADSVNVQVEDGNLVIETERKQPERAEGRAGSSVGAQLRHDSPCVHDARRCERRWNQGDLSRRRARGDGGEEARVQADPN